VPGPVQLLKSEVTHWEREANTQMVDGLTHEVGLQPGQGRGVGNLGKVIALRCDGPQLPTIAVGCLETPQVLDLHVPASSPTGAPPHPSPLWDDD